MSKVKVKSIEKAEIYPINSMNSFSFRNGAPVINFEFAPTPNKLIDTSTLRLNFRLTCGTGSGADFRFFNNQETYGARAAATGLATGSLNSRVSVVSVLDSIKLSNQKS